MRLSTVPWQDGGTGRSGESGALSLIQFILVAPSPLSQTLLPFPPSHFPHRFLTPLGSITPSPAKAGASTDGPLKALVAAHWRALQNPGDDGGVRSGLDVLPALTELRLSSDAPAAVRYLWCALPPRVATGTTRAGRRRSVQRCLWLYQPDAFTSPPQTNLIAGCPHDSLPESTAAYSGWCRSRRGGGEARMAGRRGSEDVTQTLPGLTRPS